MGQTYMPRTDAAMLEWSRTLAAELSAAPESYGVSQPAAAELAALQARFADASERTRDPSTRTRVAVADKNAALADLQAAARLAVMTVRGHGVSPGMLVGLGLPVPAGRRQAIPPPAERPVVSVLSVNNRVVRVRLANETVGRRARPDGATGAAVFAAAGAGASLDTESWVYRGLYTRPVIDLTFDDDLPPGTAVSVTAQWLNPRGQPGPAADAVRTHLGGGLAWAA